ncbi:zinc ribbon domain-containing protein [Bacillus horti]|uniref:DNA-directed RNA polymerase subunit RPC12/RpoP n=1 Tax=Caldalkalibacillus horti TaxID=77523 RepID=A0ABT9VXS0_9BACI|nr:zinc ribbon domain-containing protein [Bacillus horti]MDQ0165764.1 DNA-directed RNA polymerase subunit RPC12/RpoP [Bacillus horti]
MKSIKPGRGPSALGGIGSVVVGVLGVFWTIGAASMGAPSFFVLAGVVFVGIAIVQGIYHFKNASGKNRMSLFDITDANDEPDPLNEYINNVKQEDKQINTSQPERLDKINFCPYCGNKISGSSYVFCPKCGKEIRS